MPSTILRRAAGSAIALAASFALGARLVHAERYDGDGFSIEIPAGFVRAEPVIEHRVGERLVASAVGQSTGDVDPSKAVVRVYRKAGAGDDVPTVVVIRTPGTIAPADDERALRKVRDRLDEMTSKSGPSVSSLKVRESPRGLKGVEVVMRADAPGAAPMTVRQWIVPRDGFVVSVYLLTPRIGADDGATPWESLIASLESAAPPPPRAGLSEKAIRGFLAFAGLIVVGIVLLVVFWAQHRRAARSTS